MRAVNPRFMVTVGAVVVDDAGRVLLLEHVFRKGNGWGIPGGFLKRGEDGEDALRRELREEARLEVCDVRLISTRTFRHPQQIELIFRARAMSEARARSLEIAALAWFRLDELPDKLTRAQRRIIERALRV